MDVQWDATGSFDFARFIQGRRSIRRYQDRPLEKELLEKLLAAATWAPSAHNRQPWRFCVVTSNMVKQEISAHMAAYWRRDLGADGSDPVSAGHFMHTPAGLGKSDRSLGFVTRFFAKNLC